MRGPASRTCTAPSPNASKFGERWTLLIIRDAFLGVTRFEDFTKRLGIARNILNQRRTHLVDSGIFNKVQYSKHPPRILKPPSG
jgi:DNA-binding HxlR family transcriptional regulator